MSISRKNWSALSSMARQWTMEDEEEVERERRRRLKSSSSTSDPNSDLGGSPSDTPVLDATNETDATCETFQSPSSVDQMQMDFVEMLRVRDERRRMRHVETLRRQKEIGEDGTDSAEERGGGPPSEKREADRNVGGCDGHSGNGTTSSDVTRRQRENGAALAKEPDPELPSSPARKFVSSVTISMDNSSSASGRSTPMSPLSPRSPMFRQEHSPCPSPSRRDPQSPVSNGYAQQAGEKDLSSSSNFEQTTRPAFVRHSSRTMSFRLMSKKAEEDSPLQRSASVRTTSKKVGADADQNTDEEKTPSFQRNSRQRISSRSIQEKMERLAHAAQKSETMRSPDVSQRTLLRLEEVSRKRGIFEKEPGSPGSPGLPRQEFRGHSSGMSDRINHWRGKTNQTGSSQSPTDLRHVDIGSKRSLFEKAGEGEVSNNSPGRITK